MRMGMGDDVDKQVVDTDEEHEKGDDGAHNDVEDNDNTDDDKTIVDPNTKHEEGDASVHYDVDDNDNLDNDEHVVDPNAEHEKGNDGVHRAEDKAKAGAKTWEYLDITDNKIGLNRTHLGCSICEAVMVKSIRMIT